MIFVRSLVNRSKQKLKSLARQVFGSSLGRPLRRWWIWRHYPDAYAAHPAEVTSFIRSGQRLTNFYYDLENQEEGIIFVANASGESRGKIAGLIEEVINCHEFARQVEAKLRQTPGAPTRLMLGRRLLWYALARVAPSGLIIETGVDQGLGSAVFALAAGRGGQRAVGIDIRPDAGFLVPDYLHSSWELVVGDSLSVLDQRFEHAPVSLFIHDSKHSEHYERKELLWAWDRLIPGGFLLSDNAHVTQVLRALGDANGVAYHFFREAPADHWYPGGGIGLVRKPHAPTPAKLDPIRERL